MSDKIIYLKDKIRYVTVSALTKYIKRKFDADPHLRDIYVKGEISNFKRHSSGHLYFTLKDSNARISAVMFLSDARNLPFEPEDGMTVLARGEISVYEPNGQYQLYVSQMQPEGIGALYLAFEQLKEKLEKEGLFREEKKKPLPPYPKTVGVVTSPTGAAIRDIITTIRRRYPIARIILYPATVQGETAAPSVARAIKTANERKEADVLIVGRGGGSIEELWAFNEEIVARAIYESDIPVISAVGHETDTTIADFVADRRAPTPTGAAELAVPNIDDIIERILNRKIRMIRAMKERYNAAAEWLNRLKKSYAFRYPERLYEQKMEQLDRTLEQLNRLLKQKYMDQQQELRLLTKRIAAKHPQHDYEQAARQFHERLKRLNRSMSGIYKLKQKEYVRVIQTLSALSPLKVMERGFSIVYDEKDGIVKSVRDVKENELITVTVSDGKIEARVTDRKEERR